MASQEDLAKAEELLEQIKTEFGKLELFVSQPDWIEIARQQAKMRNKNICVHRQIHVTKMSPRANVLSPKSKNYPNF
jgi:hypothetical protein